MTTTSESKKKRAPRAPRTEPAVIENSPAESPAAPTTVEKKRAPAAPIATPLRDMALKALKDAPKNDEKAHTEQLELEQAKKLTREMKNVLGLDVNPGGPLYEQDGLVFLVRRGDLMVMAKCRLCKARDPRADKQIVNSMVHLGQIIATHAEIHAEHIRQGKR